MKILVCAILVALSAGRGDLPQLTEKRLAVKDPAAARDLSSFYRSIRALSADSVLNGTAVAIV